MRSTSSVAIGRAGGTAWWAGLVGVLVMPLQVLPMEALLPSWAPYAVTAVRGVGLFMMFVAIILLRPGRSGALWKSARADAEKARAEVFRAIIEAAGRAPGALRQALDCLRAAHLDRQLAFYKERIPQLDARFERERRRTLPFKVIGYALSTGAAVLGAVAVLNFAVSKGLSIPIITTIHQWITMLDAPHRWSDGLNATAATLLAFAGARFLTHEDFSNAALYPWALQQLERVRKEELPRAEAAADQGEVEAVQEFRRKVQYILTTEHDVWSGKKLPTTAALR